MDFYYRQAEKRAQKQIAGLDYRLETGEISKDEYDRKVADVRACVPLNASELAWARHNLAETEKRNLGIPTAGSSQSGAIGLPFAGRNSEIGRAHV